MNRIVAFLLVALIFGSACKENTKVNTISGKVFQDCETPLANTEIALKSNSDGSFNAPIILGSGITTADGTLNFTYELEDEDLGTGSLLLIKPTGFEVLLSSIQLNQDFNSLKLFQQDFSDLIIDLSGSTTLGATDTLFYGVTNNETVFQSIQPSFGLVDTISVESSNPNAVAVIENFYFGIGSADFLRAKASASNGDSTFNKISLSLMGCGTESQVNIVLD